MTNLKRRRGGKGRWRKGTREGKIRKVDEIKEVEQAAKMEEWEVDDGGEGV